MADIWLATSILLLGLRLKAVTEIMGPLAALEEAGEQRCMTENLRFFSFSFF